jgi:glucokinase
MKARASHPPHPVLLADIGGTNARFAVLADGAMSAVAHMAVSDYRDFNAALGAYLSGLADAGSIRSAILAASGAVRDNRCALTNNDWVIDAAALRSAYGLFCVRLINDFEAVAWSLRRLSPDRLLALGGQVPSAEAPCAALGPGTGLGMAVSIPHAVGHASIAGGSLREDAVIAYLRQRYGHVSAERVLSGRGLENLYAALAALDGVAVPERRAADVMQTGIEGSCAVSRAAVDMFCAMLGSVAGNLALTFGAKGGVYVGGGILRRVPDYLARSEFRARFEDKGRFRKYLAPIPAWLILDEDAAFVGLRALAEVEAVG